MFLILVDPCSFKMKNVHWKYSKFSRSRKLFDQGNSFVVSELKYYMTNKSPYYNSCSAILMVFTGKSNWKLHLNFHHNVKYLRNHFSKKSLKVKYYNVANFRSTNFSFVVLFITSAVHLKYILILVWIFNSTSLGTRPSIIVHCQRKHLIPIVFMLWICPSTTRDFISKSDASTTRQLLQMYFTYYY